MCSNSAPMSTSSLVYTGHDGTYVDALSRSIHSYVECVEEVDCVLNASADDQWADYVQASRLLVGYAHEIIFTYDRARILEASNADMGGFSLMTSIFHKSSVRLVWDGHVLERLTE